MSQRSTPGGLRSICGALERLKSSQRFFILVRDPRPPDPILNRHNADSPAPSSRLRRSNIVLSYRSTISSSLGGSEKSMSSTGAPKTLEVSIGSALPFSVSSSNAAMTVGDQSGTNTSRYRSAALVLASVSNFGVVSFLALPAGEHHDLPARRRPSATAHR